MPRKVFIIVGGGIIGCSTAHYLSLLDPEAHIILIERHEIAGSSSGKAGGFLASDWARGRPSGPLSEKSFSLHRALGETFSEVDYRTLSTVELRYSSFEGNTESSSQNISWIKDGYDSLESLGTNSSTAQVHPKKLTTAFYNSAVRNCSNLILLHKEVTGVRLEADGRTFKGVTCNGGEFVKGDAVLFALGPWSSSLHSWLKKSTYLNRLGGGTRCHSVVIDAPDTITNTAIFADVHLKSYELYPRPDGTIYICGGDDDEPLPANPSDVSPDLAKIEDIASASKAIIPSLSGRKRLVTTACYIPVSPDSEPVIGPLEEYEGIYVGCGFNVWGILNGPGAGLSLAELLLKKSELTIPEVDLLAPKRFK